VTAMEAAQALGVTRRTVYRWIAEQRLAYPLDRQQIENNPPRPRQRGPQRSRWSIRYTRGRHTFRPREERTE
jgi:excisionase family DNA binding protein